VIECCSCGGHCSGVIVAVVDTVVAAVVDAVIAAVIDAVVAAVIEVVVVGVVAGVVAVLVAVVLDSFFTLLSFCFEAAQHRPSHSNKGQLI